ncbi:type IV pilus assembly PilZ [Solidesulfovibrio carbinoliphilus subsp. oakridgensis]|uniref:Type IV pilus assembly PilZ n=1 Tax=Solidesulfovibrio carbinoliphilus subsp. oakridgensis TaxID=694327 RepID=G7QBS4_9BACT|nr:flagellar brake protein [Solidesulfovibrio carbinoliphilus]EHJ49417.1 type IV pilus assembly PilZ [Solidesulfovibrio carbinoliphilus subsp. oakridgensis]
MTAPLAAGFHCPPGTKMLLEVAGYGDKLATACVGHARGRFVVVQMPGQADSGRDALYQMLAPDNAAIVRYLHEGTVVGFSARIIKWIQVPFPLVFLTYPARLESHDLRRHPRVSCCLPGKAGLGGAAVAGMILDLSLSGCQFSVLHDEKTPAVAIDDKVGLSCALFGAPSPELSCSVKRVALSGRRLEIGLKFLDVPAQTRDALTLYLQTALSVLG